MERSGQWSREKTRRLVMVSMLTAILIIFQFTPIGYIPIPGFNPTLMHIPVIIGAIMLGPAEGAFLGLVFGLTSIIQATLQVPLTGFIFSPFVPLGNWKSVIIAIVPRVLVGLVAAYVFRLIARADRSKIIACIVASVAGSAVNTVLVLSGVYVFFREDFAVKMGKSASLVMGILLGVVTTSGVAEAAAAAVICTLVCLPLFKVTKKYKI
jgi:uncharacterized membrane protein